MVRLKAQHWLIGGVHVKFMGGLCHHSAVTGIRRSAWGEREKIREKNKKQEDRVTSPHNRLTKAASSLCMTAGSFITQQWWGGGVCAEVICSLWVMATHLFIGDLNNQRWWEVGTGIVRHWRAPERQKKSIRLSPCV